MALARARRDSGMNYWPGFVDALSTLILGIIFLLTVFVLVQFYLTQEVTGKDTALNRLNAQIAQLDDEQLDGALGRAGLRDRLLPDHDATGQGGVADLPALSSPHVPRAEVTSRGA